jgi:hypothetical protein
MAEQQWKSGDAVWVRMATDRYPGVITGVAEYCEVHSDGYECQQYYADVTFPQETVKDGLVSQCMLTQRDSDEEPV